MSSNISISADRSAILAFTVEEMSDYVGKVGADYRKRSTESTLRAGRATYGAYLRGILVDRGEQKHAHTVTTAAFAAEFGTGHTNVPVWRVIGTLIMRHECTMTDDDKILSSVIGRNLAQHPAIAAAVLAADATRESIAAAIDANTDEDGKRLPVKREQKDKDETLGAVQDDEGKRVEVGFDLGGVSTLMAAVCKILGTMGDEDYRKGVVAVHAALDSIDKARTAAAAAA